MKIETAFNPTIEVEKYVQEPLLTRNQDPLRWWEDRRYVYKHLYSLMKGRFCIPATSVPCERIFSKTGQILTDRRSSLSPSKVEKIVFLNYNLKFLQNF